MRKLFKAGLCGLAAMMLITGCSKTNQNQTAGETTESVGETTDASGESSESGAETEAATTAEIPRGTVESLGEYKGVEITAVKPVVQDVEVETAIENILAGNPDYEEDAPGPAKEGDTVNIDYTGYMDGKAFDGGSDRGSNLILGSGQFIPGFEDGLIGAKKGDKLSLDLTFPDSYQNNPDMAGKAATFEVTVNSIKAVKEAELNDDFVKKISPEDGTVEKFRQSIHDMILEQKQIGADQQRDTDLINAVVEKSKLTCNQDAIDEIYDMQITQYTQQAAMYGMELKDYVGLAYGMDEPTFQSELKSIAKKLVEQELVLDAIAEKENLTVTDEDRQALSEKYGYPDVQSMIDSVGEKEVNKSARLQKAIDLIVDNAKITEKETTEAQSEAETTAAAGAEETKAQ